MEDMYQVKLEATNILINEKVAKKSNVLNRKEAYEALKEGFCVWTLKKNSSNKYIKVMGNWANDKLLYVKKYGLYADKLNFENFNFNVNKLQEKNERIYFIIAISYKAIEEKAQEIIKNNNLNFDFSGYKVFS